MSDAAFQDHYPDGLAHCYGCGRVEEIKEKKVVVSATLLTNGEATAKGRVVAVLMPDSMAPKAPEHGLG